VREEFLGFKFSAVVSVESTLFRIATPYYDVIAIVEMREICI
jgi:hypothetical protein